MNTATVTTKVNALQACLADLHARGADALVESVNTTRINLQPIIRLRHNPPGMDGTVIGWRRQRNGALVKTLAAESLGCQLRWEQSE